MFLKDSKFDCSKEFNAIDVLKATLNKLLLFILVTTLNIRLKASSLVNPFLKRKRILFLCTENSCRSQMASAFAQHFAGDRIEVESAGSNPGEKVNDVMVQVMQEKGIDMAFRKPKSTADVVSSMTPELIVSMGCEKGCPFFPDAPYQDWKLPDPADKPIGFMREIRDTIEQRVRSLIETL